MLGVVAVNFVRKECIEEFKKTAAELVAETKKEAGCVAYDLFQEAECGQRLAFIECWESKEHLDAHFKTPHFVKIVPLLKAMADPSGEGGATVYNKC